MRKTIIITTAIVAAVLATSAPAAAHESSATVRYSDLDLTRADDAATLRHRISRALESVCGSYASVEPFQVEQIDQCRAQAKVQAAAQFARVMNEAGKRLAVR